MFHCKDANNADNLYGKFLFDSTKFVFYCKDADNADNLYGKFLQSYLCFDDANNAYIMFNIM